MAAFCDITPCSLVEVGQRFRGAYGSTALYPRRLSSSRNIYFSSRKLIRSRCKMSVELVQRHKEDESHCNSNAGFSRCSASVTWRNEERMMGRVWIRIWEQLKTDSFTTSGLILTSRLAEPNRKDSVRKTNPRCVAKAFALHAEMSRAEPALADWCLFLTAILRPIVLRNTIYVSILAKAPLLQWLQVV
jgi:hypothetical protein